MAKTKTRNGSGMPDNNDGNVEVVVVCSNINCPLPRLGYCTRQQCNTSFSE